MQIDCHVVSLMEDNTLKEYLPAYGDRIATMAFCKKSTTTPGTSRDTSKSSLLENLKKGLTGKDMVKTCTSTSRRHLVGNKHAKKELKRVELGWMHFLFIYFFIYL